MANESFEKMDESLMKQFEKVREKKVSPELLKGFSASVESKIREKKAAPSTQIKPARSFVPLWAPVFAVLVIGFALVLRTPFGTQGSWVKPAFVQLASVSSSNISEDIAAMQELGVWTEEDEKAIGASPDSELEELEVSDAGKTS